MISGIFGFDAVIGNPGRVSGTESSQNPKSNHFGGFLIARIPGAKCPRSGNSVKP